jgi:hypothetical protein
MSASWVEMQSCARSMCFLDCVEFPLLSADSARSISFWRAGPARLIPALTFPPTHFPRTDRGSGPTGGHPSRRSSTGFRASGIPDNVFRQSGEAPASPSRVTRSAEREAGQGS